MLENCPYYSRCDAEIRQIRGSNEHYCLGSKNWEFCKEFQSLSLGGEIIREYSCDSEIGELVKGISNDIKKEFHSQFFLAVISNQGEIIYRDHHWSERDMLIIQNLSRYKIEALNYSDKFRLQNKEDFLFLKIHEYLMLVCKTKIDSEQVVEILKPHLSEYHTYLENYLKDNPINFETKTSAKFEENMVLSMFEDLQKRLEAINSSIVLKDLNQIKEKIFELFSWNRIFYEVSLLIESLEKYPAQKVLTPEEKAEVLQKILEWREKIRKVI